MGTTSDARELRRADPQVTEQSTAAQRLIGEVTPKLAELTDDVLFGDVWSREELCPRDRSLITVAALITQYRPDQLRSHVKRALDNGVSPTEMREIVTHLAFYAGWPSAVSAAVIVREVMATRGGTDAVGEGPP